MVSATQDSGTTQTILHERLAVKAGVKIRRTVMGQADIRITYDKYIHETTALVNSDVNYNLLAAWHDLQFINALSPNFPACVSATMSESVKEQIVDEFPEVFRDTLMEEPMRVHEMWIELRDNAVPYCITTPRQVQLRYQDSVSKMLEDLVASKILLPTGKYRYLRAPMGLSSSSDKWCRQSDKAIEGMTFARKIVDDILVQANSLPD